MKCLKCGSENSASAKFCRSCGNNLNSPRSVSTPITAPCPSCGQANEPGKKFCSKCGASMTAQAPLPVEQQQSEVKATTVPHDEGTKLCPKCNNNLKLAAKFCGKCGFNFEQQNPRQPDELEKVISEPIEAVDSMRLPSNTAAVAEIVNQSPAAKVDVPQAKSPVEQAKPDIMQPVARKPVVSPQVPMSEKAKQRPSGLIAAVGVLLVCAIGGGVYWWFSARQVVPAPAADMGNMQAPAAIASTASAVVAASEPVTTPVAAEAALPALAPSPIVPPVISPVAQPVIPPVVQPVPLPKPTAQPVQEKLHENGKVTKLLDDARKYVTQGNYKQAEEAMKFCEMIDEGNQDCQRMKQKAVQLNEKMFDCVSAGKEWVDGRCN